MLGMIRTVAPQLGAAKVIPAPKITLALGLSLPDDGK